MTTVFGWTASFILLLTIIHQSRQQTKDDGQSASPLLFLGQGSANLLFIVYASLQGDPVFIVTNSLLLTASTYGVVMSVRRKGSVAKTARAAAEELPGMG